jgi:sterol 3beta-glucosyltransferase
MQITILTVGSRGDIQPFIALGLGLKKAGHQVRLATHANFENLISSYQLNYFQMEGDIQTLMQEESGKKLLDAGTNPFGFIRQYAEMIEPLMERALAQSWEACQASDLIIALITAFWGYDIAERLQIPFFLAGLQPISPTGDFPTLMMPPLPLGRAFNRLSYPVMRQLLWQPFYRPINHWRTQTLKLSPLSRFQQPWGRMERNHISFLYGYSPTIVPKSADWNEHLNVTGYWFLDHPENFVPPSDLVDFLAAGKPPVYIGFGSMTGRNPEVMTDIALNALKQANQRGILSTGWGGISNADLPHTVFKIDSIPHDWLFPKMSAIVHHGGAGTTAATIKAGIPSIIIPFIVDQPFWGQRVAKLGIGTPPIPRNQLTSERLATAITMAVENQPMQTRAAALGEKIRSENGVQTAIDVINNYKFQKDAL